MIFMPEFSLNNPPLICVVARVQFALVAKMENYIPDLQESLRINGYPLAQDAVTTKNWRIEDRAEAGMNVAFQESARWDISNVEKTVTIRVDRESVTLLFTDYDHFRNAEPQYRLILELVEKSIPGLLPQLIQLRYIGYIACEPPSDPKDWVLPSVLGMPNLGDLKRQGSISETNFLTPEGGQLVTRCMSLGPNHLALPPDLLPFNGKLKYDLQSKLPFLLLENIHQRQAEPAAFSAESCLAQISALRRYNAAVFQATVLREILERWK
jgi:uncharacterized protein (TIGR04255 family)